VDTPVPQLTRESVLDSRAVAELLHLPTSTVFEYARRGVLPAHKLGRRWVFIRDELDAAVRAAPAAPSPRRPRRPQPARTEPGMGVAPQPQLPFDTAA
jgi:excisionase family DNA binding protein